MYINNASKKGFFIEKIFRRRTENFSYIRRFTTHGENTMHTTMNKDVLELGHDDINGSIHQSILPDQYN